MAIYDRWHTRKPRTDPETGKLVQPCSHSARGEKLYPSKDHERGDRWQVRWRDLDGKQCKRNFAKRAGKNPNVHAEAFDKQVQGELATGTYRDPTAGQIRLKDYALTWRDSLVGKERSLDVIDRHLAHICDLEHPERGDRRVYKGESIIAERSMAELARRLDLTQQWIKSLEQRGLSPRSIRLISGTLSAIYRSAVDEQIITRNPMRTRSVRTPSVAEKPIEPWTTDQIRAAAVALDSALPEVGAGTGLRNGELCGFAVEDIHADYVDVRRQILMVDGTLVFALPKMDKIRQVPLGTVLAGRLEEHMAQHPPLKVTLPWEKPEGRPVTAELVFYRPMGGGKPWYRHSLSRAWRSARAAVGVSTAEGNGIHVLRHTFASACLSEGVDVVTLAEWLGHEDPAFTLRVYGHLMSSASGKGRAAIDAFFGDL